MKRILACGYYGFGNTGDEAILAALLADLAAVHPDAAVTVLAGNPEAVAAEHGVEGVSWLDIGAMIDAAEAADLMVLGGGGLFQDHEGMSPDDILTPRHGSVSYYGGFALLAGITRTPLVCYGLGVGPLRSEEARRYTRLAAGRASAVAVRDAASAELLTEIGVDPARVAVTADPVWALDPAPAGIVPGILALEGAPPAPRTIGVAVRPWGDGAWAAPLAAALDRLVSELDARVLFVPFHDSPHPHESDAEAALDVLRRMARAERAKILRGGYTPAERAAILGGCDAVVAMRLHGVILAAVAGAPVVGLSYDPKVAAALAELGRPAATLDGLGPETVVDAVGAAIAAGPVAGETLRRLRERAAGNRGVLAGPFTLPPFDAETADALAALAFARARTQAADEDEIGRLRRELARTEIAFEEAARERDELAAQRDTIVGSRAFKAVQGYWDVRESLRSGARRTARRVPGPLRPVLDVLAGAEPSEPVATAPTGGGDPVVRRQIAADLDAILAAHPDVPGVVVYPPSIGWNVSLFQRPQQMALAFARLGYLVVYALDPVNNEGVVGFRHVADRLYLASLPWGMNDLYEKLPEPVAVSYVYNYEWTRYLRSPRVVFEHIDELEVFTAAHKLGNLRRWYADAVAGADLVAASAGDLLASVRRDRPDAILCPNGVDYRHFARPAGEPPADVADLVAAGRPVVGYYGAIAEWVDFPLIRRTAEAMPDVELVFIGPEYDASVRHHLDVFDLPNVRWLGVKDYAELPAYLAAFDVATIPFVVNDVTQAVSPIKLFEYMAGGRPVVTPDLRECARYEAVLVYRDPDEYVEQLRRAIALRHDPDHQALLRRTARANTWEMRAGTLLDALARLNPTLS